METLEINTPYIQLNQLLKYIGWVVNGADANDCITQGKVKVNGHVELRKRNKIVAGDVVVFGKMQVKVVDGK